MKEPNTPIQTTHTPGPWVWRWKSGSLHQVGTDRPYGATVLAPTNSYDEGIGVEVSDADDRLIAAAPDLLAALEALLTKVECGSALHCDLCAQARAAIAKARGVQNV